MQRIFNSIKSVEGYEDNYGNLLRSARVKLTAAQVKALNTTPIIIVKSPLGTNKYVQVEKIVFFLDYSGAIFTGANNLEFRETNGSGTKVAADIAAATLNSATDKLVEVSGIAAETTRILNAPIVVRVPVANPGGALATSTITLITFYRAVRVY